MSHRQAFMLIELLVVVSIIALLIAILLPALGAARATANAAVCKNQMRQMVLVTYLYTDDYDGVFPPGAIGGHTPWQEQYFWGVLRPYFNKQIVATGNQRIEIMICPADPDEGGVDSGTSGFANAPRSIGLNQRLNRPDSGANQLAWRRIDEVERPTQTLVWGELYASRISTSYFADANTHYDNFADWHPNEQLNLAFADGHAASSSREQLEPAGEHHKYFFVGDAP